VAYFCVILNNNHKFEWVNKLTFGSYGTVAKKQPYSLCFPKNMWLMEANLLVTQTFALQLRATIFFQPDKSTVDLLL